MVVNHPLIINWLLTRRCNLKCNFCGIVRDPKDGAYSLQDKLMNELSIDEIRDVIHFFNSFTPKPFIILYGGEPTLHKDIEAIIDVLNEKEMPYTIITNGTGSYVRNKLDTLIKDHNLKGLSMSLDPLIFNPQLESLDPHRYLKAKSALDLLTHYKEQYPKLDVVAEITVDNKNVYYLEFLLEYLTEHDIYASITVIESPKSKHYDFAALDAKDLLIIPDTKEYIIFKDIVERILNGKVNYKVHFPEILELLIMHLPDNYVCSRQPTNLTIDSDGEIRLCLRIHGQANPNIKDLIKLSPEEALNQIQTFFDKNKHYCLGCAWTCVMMTDLASKNPDFYSRITHT